MSMNPFLEDEDEEIEAPSESSNMKQLRDYAKKIERQNRSFEKELEALRTFKAQAEAADRARQVSDVFTKVGLSEKHGMLFAKLNPEGEVSEEAVLTFAQEYGLATTGGVEGEKPAPPAGDAKPTIDEGITELGQPAAQQKAGFAPAQNAGSPSGSVIDTVEEAAALAASNPEEYARLREAGRIRFSRLGAS